MAHKRKTIRDAVVTLLDTGTIVASGKVYSNRALSVAAGDLPVLNVYTESETSEIFEVSQKTLQRELTLVVEATAAQVSDATLDDTLDDLADEIETALKADQSWAGLVMDSFLSGTELAIEQGDNALALGRIRLSYTVRYFY